MRALDQATLDILKRLRAPAVFLRCCNAAAALKGGAAAEVGKDTGFKCGANILHAREAWLHFTAGTAESCLLTERL